MYIHIFTCSLLSCALTEAVSLPCAKTMLDIIARAAGRTFVGLPMCKRCPFFLFVLQLISIRIAGRNPLYLEAASSFTIDVVKARFFINLFPEFMKGYCPSEKATTSRTHLWLQNCVAVHVWTQKQLGEGD